MNVYTLMVDLKFHSRVIHAVLVVLKSNFRQVLRGGAIFLHVRYSGVAKQLSSHWCCFHAGDLGHFHHVTLHGVGAVLELRTGHAEREVQFGEYCTLRNCNAFPDKNKFSESKENYIAHNGQKMHKNN